MPEAVSYYRTKRTEEGPPLIGYLTNGERFGPAEEWRRREEVAEAGGRPVPAPPTPPAQPERPVYDNPFHLESSGEAEEDEAEGEVEFVDDGTSELEFTSEEGGVDAAEVVETAAPPAAAAAADSGGAAPEAGAESGTGSD